MSLCSTRQDNIHPNSTISDITWQTTEVEVKLHILISNSRSVVLHWEKARPTGVFTIKDTKVVMVPRDDTFIDDMVQKLTKFYDDHFRIAVLNKYLYREYDKYIFSNEFLCIHNEWAVQFSVCKSDGAMWCINTVPHLLSDHLGTQVRWSGWSGFRWWNPPNPPKKTWINLVGDIVR